MFEKLLRSVLADAADQPWELEQNLVASWVEERVGTAYGMAAKFIIHIIIGQRLNPWRSLPCLT